MTCAPFSIRVPSSTGTAESVQAGDDVGAIVNIFRMLADFTSMP